MADRIKKTIAAIVALGALAVGGSALAQAGNGSGDKVAPKTAEVTEAVEGSESAAPENSSADPDNIQEEGGSEQGEPAEANEPPEAGEESEAQEAEGTEVPGDDGPNGHADEPGDPNADHQFEGKE